MTIPVVAIGGTLCDARLWRAVPTPVLPVVAGCLPDGRMGRHGDMAAYAAELLAELPPRFALAGFSLGGLIALELAAQAPDRITRLALICAGAGPENPSGAALRRDGEARAATLGLTAHAMQDLVPRYELPPDSPLAEAVAEMAEAVGLGLYRRQNDLAISRADSRDRLWAMRMPVHLVSGAEDKLCPPLRHAEIQALLPDARRTVVADCGHMVPLGQPGGLRDLFEWLATPLAPLPDGQDNRCN